MEANETHERAILESEFYGAGKYRDEEEEKVGAPSDMVAAKRR